MQIGDLVRYLGTKKILVVMKLRRSESSERGAEMIRCFDPCLSEYYWFYPDTLEVLDENR
jgi:hypothetical protein